MMPAFQTDETFMKFYIYSPKVYVLKIYILEALFLLKNGGCNNGKKEKYYK